MLLLKKKAKHFNSYNDCYNNDSNIMNNIYYNNCLTHDQSNGIVLPLF